MKVLMTYTATAVVDMEVSSEDRGEQEKEILKEIENGKIPELLNNETSELVSVDRVCLERGGEFDEDDEQLI